MTKYKMSVREFLKDANEQSEQELLYNSLVSKVNAQEILSELAECER